MKIKRLLKTVALLAIFFAGATTAEAGLFGQRYEKCNNESRFFGMRIIKQLDLSDEQKTKVANIIIKYRDQQKNYAGKMKEARENLMKVMNADLFNEADLRQTHQDASAVREDMLVLKRKVFSEIKTVLEPEQLEELKERRANRREKMRERCDNKDKKSRMDKWLGKYGGEKS